MTPVELKDGYTASETEARDRPDYRNRVETLQAEGNKFDEDMPQLKQSTAGEELLQTKQDKVDEEMPQVRQTMVDEKMPQVEQNVENEKILQMEQEMVDEKLPVVLQVKALQKGK